MSESFKHIETQLVHAGEPSPRIAGAVEMPIFQSATYEYAGEGSYHDIRYLRINNTPSQTALHAKLAALEGGEAALVMASGMAAISTTLLTVLSPGDHLLAQSGLYGGTHDLVVAEFQRLGIERDFIDADRRESWSALLRPTTRAIYVEAMTNPLLEVADLEGIVQFAREHGLTSIIDNTFATPVNFRPLAAGFDLCLHSATKYLNGHADIVAGAVIGAAATIEQIRHRANHLGGSLDPHAAFLLKRGLKTLALRVRYQNESTLRIAQFLEKQPAVVKVNYPGLESHPRHARARWLFAGYGGVLSFELEGGERAAQNFAQRVRIPAVAPSLGGVQTLLTRPATTSHAGLSREERLRLGINDGLLRLSVGIEATEDLLEDFAHALG
ncbi:MAG: aminotransferase class I/II-fold pyridoxal phosphate-dependent enzyme [Sinobacteraceae bacterium]|nr:aminotransferase class I/II-fold pyridoxal phosphate-dependent enzyme [Nevskiaceae bacterium]MBV9317239.1 aminotransferase class I/II-fold pyridoxal phosphate-dependent enzyme [Gammaproteobacteria bacterium]